MRQGLQVAAIRPRVMTRAVVALLLAAVFLAVLGQRVAQVDPGAVLAAIGAVGPVAWIGAGLATGISFWAIGRYDEALHRHLATGVQGHRARRAGLAALAISQTVGLGLISGALVRWRLLPELSLWAATRLTLAVTVSFLAGWAVVTALVLVLLPGAPFATLAAWGLAVAGLGLIFGRVLVAPHWRWPNGFTLVRVLGLTALDCGAAALALWLLMPGEIGFANLLPAFLLALGARLVSGAPGGLGAFEVVLLALLPGVPEAEVLAAVLAWRVVYFALPAVAGAVLAIKAGKATAPLPRPAPLPRSAPWAAARFPEAGLARQGEMVADACGWIAGRTRHALVVLRGPVRMADLRAAAHAEARLPVIYKADARMATTARQAGFRVLAVAREAWLCPQDFSRDTPARAGLRRKLRRAVMAGVTVAGPFGADLSVEVMAELAAVNAAWIIARGPEFGFSMGRFEPGYVRGQRVFVARVGGRAVGFATFHAGEQAWSLDLLRPHPDCPDGTAQMLIIAALAAARGVGVAQLSLAAAPIGSFSDAQGLVARATRRLLPGTGAGLQQFKAGFDPRWQPLYIAAPGWAGLALAGWEIAHRVHRPRPVVKLRAGARRDEEYEFASARLPWHRMYNVG
ncbi:phosphatidylglycerol lysyltransferase domain-containing protein [Tabrizicola sp.]|uniref:phosphatidylglycerol lysyltransferase domain-containing protein n=1 Tax=Tabrizicola sp. TaxID=2005166 RepID=UPI00286C8932|nr:phosphatidylglycerol lysyltransferase domain-containing protein [Tabrizicola sp.]